MERQAGLKRALGQRFAVDRNFEQDFFVLFRDIAGGFQPFVHTADGIPASFFHRTFQNTFGQIPVLGVHT